MEAASGIFTSSNGPNTRRCQKHAPTKPPALHGDVWPRCGATSSATSSPEATRAPPVFRRDHESCEQERRLAALRSEPTRPIVCTRRDSSHRARRPARSGEGHQDPRPTARSPGPSPLLADIWVIAYEPVWRSGTGKDRHAEDGREVRRPRSAPCRRKLLRARNGNKVRVLTAVRMKPENADDAAGGLTRTAAERRRFASRPAPFAGSSESAIKR